MKIDFLFSHYTTHHLLDTSLGYAMSTLTIPVFEEIVHAIFSAYNGHSAPSGADKQAWWNLTSIVRRVLRTKTPERLYDAESEMTYISFDADVGTQWYSEYFGHGYNRNNVADEWWAVWGPTSDKGEKTEKIFYKTLCDTISRIADCYISIGSCESGKTWTTTICIDTARPRVRLNEPQISPVAELDLFQAVSSKITSIVEVTTPTDFHEEVEIASPKTVCAMLMNRN